ncbi:MAG: tRNA preQ1(34) S-adenosylmethionine ribosyltransferase-isomerase QueA, partial [Bdellovibrionales bacterium]|nr:tRNA preQ1(34) S-adenosylmethionine ribosyltransferase-isomerase QueA [Bdellovibrionales bacterium]
EPYQYKLPDTQIAQRPCYPYHDAQLLVVRRDDRALLKSTFIQLSDYLQAGDLLVFNDTKVIPARLFGTKRSTGAAIEVLLLRALELNQWTALIRPKKRVDIGTIIDFESGSARVHEVHDGPEVILNFDLEVDFEVFLEESGVMPIPPYIRKGRADSKDKQDYQSRFAKTEGSVAAPTASLHFTDELMQQMQAKGIASTFLTLHVGAASFLPVIDPVTGQLSSPGAEYYRISDAQSAVLMEAKKAKRRVIAVGTTVARALESWSGLSGDTGLNPTSLFIQPGHQWRVCDGLVTNFHQPGTTHLLLVEALLGRSLLDEAYQYALGSDFRFLSYGDGMCIV